MAVQFRLAAFGHTMETGRVVEWHIAEGSRIEEGQPLVSIETDKTVVEVESPVSGVMLRIVGQADGEYDVGETLAWIGEEGEVVPDAPAAAPKTQTADQPAESRATPVALRLAQRHGIDAESLPGTGPGGRVTKEDVQRAIDAGGAIPESVVDEKPAASTAEGSRTSAADRPSGGACNSRRTAACGTAQHRCRIARWHGTWRAGDEGGCATGYRRGRGESGKTGGREICLRG